MNLTFTVIEKIAVWGLNLTSHFGYLGLFAAMTLESAAVPIPSEVVVPFGGFLASSGQFSFWLVVLVATFANLTGSLILFFVGRYIGLPVLRRFGKYFLIHRQDIEKMEFWLQKYGGRVAFLSRIIPGTRTFSSLVIGAGEVSLPVFFWYTLAGSFAWNLLWTYLGYVAGQHWNQFGPYIRKFDYSIAVVIAIALATYIIRHIRHNKKNQ